MQTGFFVHRVMEEVKVKHIEELGLTSDMSALSDGKILEENLD